MERFIYTVIEFIVDNRVLVFWFFVSNRLNVCKREKFIVNYGQCFGFLKIEIAWLKCFRIMEEDMEKYLLL